MAGLSQDLQALKRRLLTSAIAVTTVGIVALVLLIARLEGQARDDRLDAELNRRATAARSLIYYDEEGNLRLDGLLDDEAINGSPQVFVVTLDEQIVFGRQPRDVEVDLIQIARPAMREDVGLALTLLDANGVEARVVAEPFYNDATDEVAGAAVVTGDSTFEQESFDRFMRSVIGGAAALIAALSLGGWLLIRRSLAPAEDALIRQERFVADAAHELRRPLTALRVTAERGVASGDMAGALDRSVEIVDGASSMVDTLLTLARLDATGGLIDGKRLRLDQLVETIVVETLADQPDITVIAQEVVVVGDATLIEQAVKNLIANGREHGRSPMSISVAAPGTIVVQDTGDGFVPDDIDSAFERFRSDPASTGSGLGLALVVSVMRVHGGSVSARNHPDGGAEITLEFTQ